MGDGHRHHIGKGEIGGPQDPEAPPGGKAQGPGPQEDVGQNGQELGRDPGVHQGVLVDAQGEGCAA